MYYLGDFDLGGIVFIILEEFSDERWGSFAHYLNKMTKKNIYFH